MGAGPIRLDAQAGTFTGQTARSVLGGLARRIRAGLPNLAAWRRPLLLPAPPSLPNRSRVYAIGDIHGRLDLFQRLLDLIRIDTEARGRAQTHLVILGDFIDRGPDSARLSELLFRIQQRAKNVVVLKGNHEATMLDVIAGDHEALELWLRHGGDAALKSWEIDPALMDADRMRELTAAMRAAIPEPLRRWMEALPTSFQRGDYLFVHAGIRPGVALRRQSAHDHLWIRDEFLDAETMHGAVIVHGHSIEDTGPVFRSNRIGIDTGAYRTERLTALGLEGTARWSIST